MSGSNKTLAPAIVCSILALLLMSCSGEKPEPVGQTMIKNEKAREHEFLSDMYSDGYYPNLLVDKCREILVDLCIQIETRNPTSEEELFELTHAATERINDLDEEFEDNDSELETGAREALGGDFAFILEAYGFDVDVEDAIAPREW